MIIKTFFNYEEYSIDLSNAIDLSISINPGKGVNAFYIPQAKFEPIRVGSFVGSVEEGGSANCENLFINAHGNGTHTECVGHISKQRISINSCLKKFHFFADLITVQPTAMDEDFIVMADVLGHHKRISETEALILRTLPNSENKLQENYSGKNPCYLHPDLCKRIREMGYKHLLIDLPSVDREEDGGNLFAHKNFWNYPDEPQLDMTITELIYVPDEIEDGNYFLQISIASLETDASPSKPLLYKMKKR